MGKSKTITYSLLGPLQPQQMSSWHKCPDTSMLSLIFSTQHKASMHTEWVFFSLEDRNLLPAIPVEKKKKQHVCPWHSWPLGLAFYFRIFTYFGELWPITSRDTDSKWIVLGPRLCPECFEHSLSHYSEDWIWCKPRYPKVSFTLSFFEEPSRVAIHKQGSSETGANEGGGKGISGFPSLGHSWTMVQINVYECSRQHDPSWLLDQRIPYLTKAEWPEAVSQVYSWED